METSYTKEKEERERQVEELNRELRLRVTAEEMQKIKATLVALQVGMAKTFEIESRNSSRVQRDLRSSDSRH